ncbi:hypothetical protein SAMN05661091_5386 [Paenibacillus uliginis N3/975]|uniref:Uncharacterized protein n=1 Tax=Paenibacillus uliginis N3/975 TaxID=1313296 RepID=A0A1X7HSR2_9BACL|nr:hypothetical protein [Paenibacillus uliginis]SMF91238.1 hypothetical protein SAMN05661091_5386 [Paenibacillus uliginis N3/975]
MDLKQTINAYQQTEDTALIDRIMEDVEEIDFTEDPTRRYVSSETSDIRITLSEPHLYIAYRIKAIREKAVKNAWYIRQPQRYAYPEINRYLSILILDCGMRIPFEPIDTDRYVLTFEINTELLYWLISKDVEIEQRFKDNHNETEYKIYRSLITKVITIEEEANQEEARIRVEVMEDMRQALAYVLKYVDADRSDREIVSYVNDAIMTRYYDIQANRNGLRRVRKSGSDRRMRPRFSSALMTVIGYEIPEWVLTKKLSEQNAEFLQKLIMSVEEDMREGREEGYNVTAKGEYVVSGAYVARVSGLPYETARKRLARIRKKLEIYSL